MISGARITLAPIAREHLDNTRRWANDPDLKQRILRVTEVTAEDQSRWFERLAEDRTRIVFAIILRDGRHIGNCGFYFLDKLHGRAEHWILIGEKGLHGQGLGREVLGLCLAHAFKDLGLHKVYAHVATNNQRGLALYQGRGFKRDGRLRDHYLIQGTWLDVVVLSMLRDEYGA